MSPSISVVVRGVLSRTANVPTERTIRLRLRKMLVSLKLLDADLTVLLTGDAEIRALNRDHRGVDRPTDVLSFSMLEGEGAEFAGNMLGDLVISVPTAKRQAKQAARPLLDEVTMLLGHGLLHLLGWDHQTKAADTKMRKKTDALCVVAGGRPLFALGGVDEEGRSCPIPLGSRPPETATPGQSRKLRVSRKKIVRIPIKSALREA